MNPGKFIVAALCALAFNVHAELSDSTKQLLELRVFPEGLVWTGEHPPTESENGALINALAHTDAPGWTTNVENFLREHPSSPWTASLRHDYAQNCRQAGRTTKALEQWEAAWPLVKHDTSPDGHRLAGTILANWMDQLSSLGRVDKMSELVAAGDAMTFVSDADRDKFQGAKNSFYLMQRHPGIAYRCGTFALKAVGSRLQPDNRALENLPEIPSPEGGFKMSALVDFAAQYKLNLAAVRRTNGQALIVPSVVHWRQNHYAAILEQRDNLYLVSDPTFGGERWLTPEVINEEAGGEFLIPVAAVTNEWVQLARNEAENIHGMGLPNTVNDAKDKGCQPGKPCPECKGMPVWWVSEPYINLWMADEPLSYLTASGEPFTFRMTYKQRDTRQAYLLSGNYLPVTGWNHSWFSSIHLQNSTKTCYAQSCIVDPETSYTTVNLPDGGAVTFAPGQHYDSETRLLLLRQNPSITFQVGPDNGTVGLRLVHPDGSQDLYTDGFAASAQPQSSPISGDLVRTSHVDPRGKTTRFIFTTTNLVNVLSAVVDPDGRTNTLKYIFPANGQALLVEVDSPEGLTAKFKYNGGNLLTNIIDAQGLSSSIAYDTNNYPSALITPYGTNKFNVFVNATVATDNGQGNLGGHDLVDRAVQVTDPTGATSLWLYRYDCSSASAVNMPVNFAANSVPVGTPLGTLDDGSAGGTNALAAVCYRNSFYWGPRQYATLLTTQFTNFVAGDYVRARMRHWLQDTNDLTLSGVLSVERDFSPDGTSEGLKTFFDYQGKTFPHRAGTNALPSVTAWRIPGGETHYSWSRFDMFGNVTNEVSTATLPDGTLGTRTNQWVYANNVYNYSYSIIGGAGSTTSNYTVPNLLAAIIGADGQTVWSAGGFDTVAWTNYFPSGSQTNMIVLTSARTIPGRLTNAVGNVATLTFSGFDQVTSLKSFSGLTTTNFYSNPTNGFLLQSIDLETGRTNGYGYTANGMVGAFTNELGLNLGFTWDNLLRPTATQFPDGTSEIIGYNRLDANYHQDRQGVQAFASFDNARHPQNYFVLDSGYGFLDARYWSWCGCGALTSVADAYTNTTILNYDNAGRLTGYTFPDNSTLTRQLDLAGRVTNLMDGAGRYLRLGYNHQGIVTNITDALGHSLRRVQFDLRDRPVFVTDANGISVTNVFDNGSRLIQRIWPDHVAEGWGYNERGLFAYTNRDGKITLYGRDVAGRAIAETNANLEVATATYNPADEITSLTDGLQHTRTWQYNQYGWVTNKTDGLNRPAFRYQYNPAGWVTNSWTPEKGDLNIARDGLGRTRGVGYNGITVKTYSYDLALRLTNFTDALGSHALAWTPANRLQSESDAWTTVSYAITNGLRTLLTIQQPGTNWTQGYQYDPAWRLTNTTTMAGSFLYQFLDTRPNLPAAILLPNGASITNTYDSLARLQSTALQDHWHHVLDGYIYGVDSLGLRTNIIRNLGLTTNSVAIGYDNINQIQSWNAKENDGTPRLNEQLGFAFDAANNLHTRVNGSLTQTFTADAADQLSSVTRSGTYTLSGVTPAPASGVLVNGQAAQTYGDFTFARTNLTLQNGTNTFSTVAVNIYNARATNLLTVNLPTTVNLAYDNNGNLTNDGAKAFFYDCENQLTNVTVTNIFKKDFVYDGLNRLRIKREYGWIGGAWQKTNELHFIWDGNVIAQIRDAGNNPLVTLTRGLDLSGSLQGAGGIGGLLAMTVCGTNYFYHQDGIGNVTALMDGREQVAYRAAYDPFNRIIRQTGNYGLGLLGASGQLYDQDTRLLHYKRRVYSPELARFLNSDPIQEWGGRNLHRYNYNNSLIYVDPYGLSGFDEFMQGLDNINNALLAMGPVGAEIGGAEKTVVLTAEEIPKATAAVADSAVAVVKGVEASVEEGGKVINAAEEAVESTYNAYQKGKQAEEALKAKKANCSTGGRKGGKDVRDLNKEIAKENEAKGAKHTAGADLPEQHYPNPNGGRAGGRYSDVENTRPDGTKIVTQTIDTDAAGVPTDREINAALDIFERLNEGDTLILVPKY